MMRLRLKGIRGVVAFAAVSSPAVMAVILLIGFVAGGERIAAGLILGYLLLIAAAAGIIVVSWTRRRGRSLDGYSFHGSIAGPAADALRALRFSESSSARDRLLIAEDLAQVPLPALFSFGAATRTSLARDILAARATGFRTDAHGLSAALASGAPTAELARALGPVDLPALIAFLRLLRSAVSDEDTDPAALCGGALLAAAHPDASALRPDDRRILAERLLLTGRTDAAAGLLEGAGSLAAPEWLLRTDTLHPDREGAAAGAETLWLTTLNALYVRRGIETVRLSMNGPTRFDRLSSDAVTSVMDGPLISIIMTSHCPGPELETAVRSVLSQSWANWELLIADDASGPAYAAVLNSAAALDPRIRILHATENRGTFVRRNDALAAATGELVTMHDSDDWAHPRRLELQAAHLIARPALLANLSRSVRATETVRLAQPRGTLLRLTETSLLFRRTQVIERIGWFDEIRKAADTGFRLRIEAFTGAPVPIVDVEVPLSIVRFSNTSLSGPELGDGWMHPARIAYSSAHSNWLAGKNGAGSAGYLGRSPSVRPFPAPAALLGLPSAAPNLDLLVVLDVREDERNTAVDQLIDASLATWCDLELTIGVMRSDALTALPLPHTARPAVQRLINDGSVVEVIHGDLVAAELIIALTSDCLVGLPPSAAPVASAEMILVTDDRRKAKRAVRAIPSLRPEIERAAHRLAPGSPLRFARIAEANAAVDSLGASKLTKHQS
jgi:glycosyltransferase involved in cell wall biosynthesis